MQDLNVKDVRTAEIANLIGVLLAVFAFVFGSWQGSQSALSVLTGLARYLTRPDLPADVSRQQQIFVILLALGLILVGLAATLYAVTRTTERRWAMAEALLAVVALLLLVILFLRFGAQTAGLSLTALGCLIAGASALTISIRAAARSYPPRAEALEAVKNVWRDRLVEARASGVPLSVLVLSTPRSMHPDVVSQVDAELRVRDVAFPAQEQLFILLWNADADGAEAVARHLQELLAGQGHGPRWIGLASFPSDADEIGVLLEHAQQAHDTARTSSERRIVRFSMPQRGEAIGLAHEAWKAPLVQAKADGAPVAVLALATSRTLHADDVALVDDELRTRDRILPVQDGLFVLLWKVSLENAVSVARHIQDTLQGIDSPTESQVGIACFPEDGDEVRVLVERAERALTVALSTGDQSVVAFRDAQRRDDD